LLRADLTAFEQGGDAQLARICRDLLRRAGAPTRRGRGGSTVPPDLRARGITSRELDVLTLVEDGLTNAAISQRLFLSPRTVETHIANLLLKTGVANRQELRTWFRALNP
jgi:DNA-binding NarL/FixJ family response regulator